MQLYLNLWSLQVQEISYKGLTLCYLDTIQLWLVYSLHLFLNWSYFPFRLAQNTSIKRDGNKTKYSVGSPSYTQALFSQVQSSSGYINDQIPNVYGQIYDSLGLYLWGPLRAVCMYNYTNN